MTNSNIILPRNILLPVLDTNSGQSQKLGPKDVEKSNMVVATVKGDTGKSFTIVPAETLRVVDFSEVMPKNNGLSP